MGILVERLGRRLKSVPYIRGWGMAAHVSLAIHPSWKYLFSYLLNRTDEYTVRKTRGRICLRAQADVRVAREYLTLNQPSPPAEVQTLMAHFSPASILDLGANIGMFMLWANSRFPGAKYVAFEPDQSNVRILRRNLELNGLERRVDVNVAAAGVAEGTASLLAGNSLESRLRLPGEESIAAESVRTVDILPYLDAAAMVKIDIEGSEWPILDDPRFRDIGTTLLCMEWHSRGCPSASGKLYAERVLRAAGFRVAHEEQVVDSCGFLWAWKPIEAR